MVLWVRLSKCLSFSASASLFAIHPFFAVLKGVSTSKMQKHQQALDDLFGASPLFEERRRA